MARSAKTRPSPGAAAPYPYPAVSHERRIQLLSEDFAAQGLRPFHTPLGVMLDESDPRKSACIRCNTCDGFPCLINAKADAQVCCVDPALRIPERHAHDRGEGDAPGDESRPAAKCTGVVVERDGATETYSADIVVVAGGAINSAALLLALRE